MRFTSILTTGIASLLILGCGTFSSLTPKSESEKLNAFLDQRFDMAVERHPEWQTYLGIKKDQDKLEDLSEEAQEKELEIAKQELEMLKKFDYAQLDPQAKISYQLFKKDLEEKIEDFKWRHYDYPVNQLFGRHSSLPAFMINMHKVENKTDALAYISRINAIKDNTDQLLTGLKIRESKGLIPPKFVFPKVRENVESLMSGQPLSKNGEHTLLKDFKSKVEALDISENEKLKLIAQLETALKESFQPAYKKLLSYWNRLENKANKKDGIWKLPDGDKYYQVLLERYTTTKMTPKEIHLMGLLEVKRIHKEMVAIQKNLGVKGSLSDMFEHLKNNKQMLYPDNQKGRDEFLKDTRQIIADMKKALPDQFGILPKANLLVKPVEPFREKSSASAFYNAPAPDGSRPGIYYVNLYNLKEQPKYKMEALAYHEALPGHHMQLSIARELEGLPKFRKFGGYTAYTEGWGLYAELAAKDMGFYKDPYSDFGRLSMELLRANRLVVDTGIHYKKWTRKQAINYLIANSPSDRSEIVRAVERYIVMPGQATAYKIGMNKIVELRDRAKKQLGSKFSIKQFHNEVLRYGALPLDVLEKGIEEWIQGQGEVTKYYR